jgi:putative protease
MHLLNAKELSMVPHISRFWEIGIRRLRIEGKAAPVAHLAQVTKLYRQVLDHGEKALPTGSELAVVEHGDITRGHYFRGVL